MIVKNFGKIHKHLIDHSIRPSLQRVSVMGYLMEYKSHPTVEEIYNALSPRIPTLSKTTVYNTLHLFVQKGAALELTIDGKNARYDANTNDHAHFYCRDCEKVYDMFDLEPRKYELPQINGFAIDAVEISYHGVCPECLSKQEMVG